MANTPMPIPNLSSLPNPAKTEMRLYIVGGIVVIVVALIIYLAIARPILQGVGVIDDKEDKEADKVIKEFAKQQWFTGIPYTANKSQVTISETRANNLATEIYNSKSWYHDCETCAIGSILAGGSKINVSFIAYRFYEMYNRSLYSYLFSFLEDKDWVTLNASYKKLVMTNVRKSMQIDLTETNDLTENNDLTDKQIDSIIVNESIS
jgi:hypothetical protein